MGKLLDPMGEELLAARQGTFGALWPHEGKKGWKCKVGRMVEAGWCFDPAPVDAGVGEEELDGVTCFYCNCSLDGWEPKDDPLKEHTRRSPECAFFKLVRLFGGGAEKKGAVKGKGRKGARVSAASKGSRLSTLSAVSQFSEAPSLADVGNFAAEDVEMEPAGVDDSIVTTASQATTTGTGKGKKGKAGRAKAPAKGAKGRKRAGTVDSQVDVPLYPDLSSKASQPAEEEEMVAAEPLVVEKKTRKAPTRGSKAPQIDSSVIEVSSLDLAPPPATEAKRGRKAKAKAEPEPEAEAAGLEDSEVSLQLQEELERSLSIDMDARFEIEEQQTSQPEKPKRGVKRTSDGMKKKQQPQEESDVSATVLEFPPPPKPTVKAKKGRKPSKQIEPEQESHPPPANQADVSISDVEATKPTKAKKAPATKAKGKSKKASSARSSKATTTEPSQPQTEEDLERDEREIEAELARIAAEQAQIEKEQEKAAEFEASPSISKPVRKTSKQSEPKIVEAVAGSPPAQSPVLHRKAEPTPSPAGSDKENDPGFARHSTQPILSPTKISRIPLAPGTPNRLLSPSKRNLQSPSKHLSHLVSATPWSPIDLDAALLASPQPTPGTLAQRLAGAASGPGVLGSAEKGLSVEEWVRLQAAKAEEELRRRCEETVGAFEREGVRGLGCLQGVGVVG